MFKYEEKKSSKHKNKKHKKKRKRSVSSSSSMGNDSDNLEWVEKVENPSSSSHSEEKVVDNKTEEKLLKRDEWMNTESFLPCFSNVNKQKPEKEVNEVMKLGEPGQSNRELNPYWRDGGNGLPQNNMEKRNSLQIMDVNWLKKSLRRAEEQALRDNRSLEEVAAERWGSLETIQSMIAKAEKISDVKEDKSNYKRYRNEKNYQGLDRNSDSGIKEYLRLSSRSRSRSRSRKRRSRSRSKSRKRRSKSRSRSRNRRSRSRSSTRTHENEKYRMSNYQSRYTEQQRAYQKPKDDDDFVNQTTMRKSSSNHIKNWKKDKTCEKKCKTILPVPELEKTSIEVNNPSNTNEEEKTIRILTEAEMNKLGAKIIKAELMGDDELAAELKAQLEEARKVAANNINVEEKTVILTKIDKNDIARPGNQSKQFSKGHRKKVSAETHISGERISDFINNDKYSLREMFQREKGISTKMGPKNTDNMDDASDASDQEIKEAKQVKRDCTYAIKEQQNLSKYMDNCWWCLDSKNMLKHMIVTMDSMICLSLPAYTSLTTNHCILTPTQHIVCQLQLDEDVLERLKELKTKLIKMFANENLYPIFFEVYKKRQKYSHMQLQCIPLPKEIGELAPIYFKKALLECETEWSVNKKIIDLKHKNIRHAVPNGLPYFMVEFASHSGYAHVIENEEMFPKNFAEEIIGGMLDLNCNLWRKPRRQSYDEQISKVLEFTELWKKYNSHHS